VATGAPERGPGTEAGVAALDEFSLIARYFDRPGAERQGVGDDCALIDVGGTTLALTSDMLVEGVHFLPGADPRLLGHKALAVNLSDLAAAGARPRCFLLALALPRADESWLAAFSRGLFALAAEHDCTLIGGDTTRTPPAQAGGAQRGPLTICITAIGEVAVATYCGRAGARPGDDIWVSGCLGEAALGLAMRRGEIDCDAMEIAPSHRDACLLRMDRPTPRVALGRALAGCATACIDVSDGLVGDLGHILARSGVGAELRWADIPRPGWIQNLDIATQHRTVLAGGDDYELLFCARAADRTRVAALAAPELAVSRIGTIESAPGLRLRNGDGTLLKTTLQAYDHFASGP